MIWFDDRKGRKKKLCSLTLYMRKILLSDDMAMIDNLWCTRMDAWYLMSFCWSYSTVYLLSFSRWRWFQSWMNQSNQSWSSFNSWIANIFFVIIRVLREAYIAFQNTCTSKRRKDFICSFLNKFPARPPNQSIVST